jgi:hypothetical protein
MTRWSSRLVDPHPPVRPIHHARGLKLAECYNTRSKLVHGATDLPDLASLRDRLRELVRNLIIAVAANTVEGPSGIADASSTS